jgi:hypothetical protein
MMRSPGIYGPWGAPPRVADRQTQAVANNQMALGSQRALARSSAGSGLSRGRGHMALDQNRGDIMRANAAAQANDTRAEDELFNATMQSRYRFGAANEQLQYDSLAEQERMGRWDSRFGNLTTAWGALAGLLR